MPIFSLYEDAYDLYALGVVGLTAFCSSLVLTPFVRDLFVRFGFVDLPDTSRKLHDRPIPRVGGIAIAFSCLLAFGAVLAIPMTDGTQVRELLPQLLSMLPAVLVIFLTGLIDDLYGLNPLEKLSGQILGAVLAYLGGVHVVVFADSPLSAIASPVLTVLWLVGCANAFNMIDGLDGLAAGVGLFATVTTLIAALSSGNLHLALVTIPLVGCLLGFLRYNFAPASIFLGDCGSLLVGFLLGCYSTLWSQKSATLLGMTAPVMVVSLPLFDTMLSICRRFLRHRPIFGADRGHIHHRLLDRGLTPRRAALVLYAVCAIAATLSLLQNVAQDHFGGLIIVVFCVIAWLGIQQLGYHEFHIAAQLFLKGTFRTIIDSRYQVKQIESSLSKAVTIEEYWAALVQGCRTLHFSGVRLATNEAIFEEMFQEDVCLWQLTITVSQGHQVTVFRSRDQQLSAFAIGDLVTSIEETLTQNVASSEKRLQNHNYMNTDRVQPTDQQSSELPLSA